MTPINDPRPFPEVLHDWMGRHRLTAYAVAKRVGAARGLSVQQWLDGKTPTYEPALRALMTLVDEGRLLPPSGKFRKGPHPGREVSERKRPTP